MRSNVTRLLAPLITLQSVFLLTSCEDKTAPIIRVARCGNDSACPEGSICIDGTCVPRDALSCQTIQGGQAILQPGPPILDFGHVGSGSTFLPLALRNIGNCTLTIFDAYFESEEASIFQCPFCSPEMYPLELLPFREHELRVFFTPPEVGFYEDTLVLVSDDAEFSEIKIPIRATFNGQPAATVAPEEVDFDYAPVGRTVTQTIQITNRGDGTAPLQLTNMRIETATDTAFSFDPIIEEAVTLLPVSLAPDEAHTVNLRYHPQEVEDHVGELVFDTNQNMNAVIRVPLRGSSKTPARISVSPENIQFGAVPLGQTTALPLTIVNEGGTPLRVTPRWGGTGLSTDLSTLPQVIPPIMPGQFTEIQVLVTATSPAPITGLLLLESNDPSRPTVTVPVSAEGQDVVGVQVLKIDMVFENGSDSFFDDDFRNVDMSLENPFGLICNKQLANPMNWGNFGNPSWLAFGPKEEPERIVLPDAQQDGTYRVLLNYVEDCSSVPTGIVAAILGVSVDALLAYLTGGIGVGFGGGELADAIDDVCLNRSSVAVTVTVFINGQVVAEEPVTMGTQGDFIYAVDIERNNGVFTVQ